MELPGLEWEPRRVALEVTLWPDRGDWSLGRREWVRNREGIWQVTGIATSATPIPSHDISTRLQRACRLLQHEVREMEGPFALGDPFP